jgi:peptidoglycan/xylan/chitin deacetylase (PgdA/CDA1 family)
MRMRAFFQSCLMLLALAPAAPAYSNAAVPCPVRDDVLGLERIVEIDSAGGPEFGSTRKDSFGFLSDGEIVLTFDDGPSRTHTRSVLAALDRHCTKATFFMVGRMAAADPAMVQEVAKAGHTVAAHTFSHARIPGLSTQGLKDEIELGFSAVSKALGAPAAPFFRYPYLAASGRADTYLRERHIASFTIDVDSRDFRVRDGVSVKRTVLAQLASKRKGILLFHDIQPSTANSLDDLLAALKEHGYKVVHIVPKQPVSTLAAYDEKASQLIAKRKRTVADEPLANRSLTWSQDSPVEEREILPWAPRITPAVSDPPEAPVTSNQESTVPWYQKWLFP